MVIQGADARDAKRKLPAERHGELLAKAVGISQAEGLSAVTLRRVATDLGVTPGLVSHYFSSAEMLIAAAFRTAALADLDAARARVGAASTPTAGNRRPDGLRARRRQRGRQRAVARRVESWPAQPDAGGGGERADRRLAGASSAIIVRAGSETGEFHVPDVDAAARRLLILIDGLGAQKVIRNAAGDEIEHIARAYVASELTSHAG